MEAVDDLITAPRTSGDVVALMLDDLTCTDNEANRQASLRAERIVAALEMARRHPEIYTHDADSDMAERSAMLDIALRLRISEDQVRELHGTACWAMRHLPMLWTQARDGFATMTAVRRVVTLLRAILPATDAPQELKDAADAVTAKIDDAASEWVLTSPPEAFRRRIKRRIDAVGCDLAVRRHTRAMADRTVTCAPAGDGMSWISALVPSHEATAVMGRLTATAKHLQKDRREGRTRSQIRADLFVSWLKGEGTATAVERKLFVTVPVQLLAGQPVPVEQAAVVGGDTIDPLTARQLFLDARSFRRVITDPVRGVVVDMDRRTYRPTRAQRDWLIVQHGTCSRDGCSRLAVDADLDHDRPWSRGGRTNIRDLRPLCPRDHRHRHRTRAVYRTRHDHTVEVRTPTGFVSDAPPPF